MSYITPSLEIKIYKLDGSVSTFVQNDDAKSKQILGDFQPLEIFNREKLFLADNHSHRVLPVSKITRIDLDSEEHCRMLFESGAVEAIELTQTEFEALVQNMAIRDQWKHLGEEDAFVVTFLKVEMADGQNVLLTMEVDAESPQGLGELRDFLLSRTGLCFRMRTGGVAVLNLANLAQLAFYPGTLPPQEGAWDFSSPGLEPANGSLDEPEPGLSAASNHQREKLTIRKRF